MKTKIFMQEEATEIRDDDKRLLIYDSGVFESRFENKSEVWKHSIREYGRCIGRAYIDTKSGKAHQIGWVFQKRVKYTDSDETYLQETWITLHNAPPVQSVTYDPMYLD